MMNNLGLSSKQSKWVIVSLLILYLLSVLINLGMMELAGEEPRRAVVSLEMMHSGNYLNPTLLGWPYHNKPPVFNWILILTMKITGSASEFVLRLPSLLFYILWAWVHFLFSKRYLNRNLALLSGLFLLTSGDIYFYGLANGAEIDIFYSFIVYLQVVSIFHFYVQQKWWHLYLASYFLCSIGFLTKGFPSIAFEVLTLVALCFYARSVKPIFKWQHLAGVAVFASVLGAYLWGYSFEGNVQHLLVNLLNESFIKSGIGDRSNKIFEKAIGYPFLLFKLMAPWSLLIFGLLLKNVRQQLWKNPFTRFSILFFVCNIGVYWFTGQPKARYIYMFVPFMMTVLVHILEIVAQAGKRYIDNGLRWFSIVFVLATLFLAIAPFIFEVLFLFSLAAAIIIGIFSWLYVKKVAHYGVLMLVLGVILLRLVYAMVFIPLQDKGTLYYEPVLVHVNRNIKKGNLWFWGPPQTFRVSVNTQLFSWQADSTVQPAYIYYHVPYYYYKSSGKLLRYDSSLLVGRHYISFAADLHGVKVDTAFVFTNKEKDQHIIVYQPLASE